MNLCTLSQRQNSVRDINFIIFSRAHEASFSYSVTHIALTCHLQYYWKQRELRHSALNWDFFYVLLTSKRGNIAFPPPVPYIQCSTAVQVTYRKQKHPNFEWRGQGEGCGCFCSLKLPYLSILSQHLCRRLYLMDIKATCVLIFLPVL